MRMLYEGMPKSRPALSLPDLIATASSPQCSTLKLRITTFEQESGSIPSVLGEFGGAEYVTFSKSRLSQAYGCIAQNGGFCTVTPTMEKFLQYIGSMRRGLPNVRPSICHQAEP